MERKQRSFGNSYLRRKIKRKRGLPVDLSLSSSSETSHDSDNGLDNDVPSLDQPDDREDLQLDNRSDSNLSHGSNISMDMPCSQQDRGMNDEVIMKIISFIFNKHCLADIVRKEIYDLLRYMGLKKHNLQSYSDFKKFTHGQNTIKYNILNYHCILKSFHSENEKCCESWHGSVVFFDMDDSISYIISSNLDFFSTRSAHAIPSSAFVKSARYEKIWMNSDEPIVNTDIRLTFMFNMDDASMVKSNNTIVTPISYTIAELPENRRFIKRNMMNACVYWGKEKIKHDLLWQESVIKPLAKYSDYVSISTNGIDVRVMAKIGLIIMDSVAKPKTLNCMLFNAEYGCPYCLARCESVHDQRSHNHRVYPYDPETNLQLKSHQIYITSAIRAEQENTTVNGINGPNVLSNIIEIPDQVPVDYMHACLEGVFRNLLNQRPYRDVNFLRTFDDHVKIMKIPHEFTRKVRSLTQLTHWKANELRFCAFYLVSLFRKLPSDQYYLVVIFSCMIRLMVAADKSNQRTMDLQAIINIFLESYQDIYGACEMKFNFHLLRHLPRQIEDLGSITEYSAFIYENNIFNLKRSFNGTRGQLRQIAQAYAASKNTIFSNDLNKLLAKNEIGIVLPTIRDYYSRIVEKPVQNHAIDEVTLSKIKRFHPWIQKENLNVFSRLRKNKTIFHSLIYNYRRSSSSYYFSYKDHHNSRKPIFGKIKYFVGVKHNNSDDIRNFYVIHEKMKPYETQSIFTGIQQPDHRKLKQILSFECCKSFMYRVRSCNDHNVIDFDKISSKAIVFKDAFEKNILWASELVGLFEHD